MDSFWGTLRFLQLGVQSNWFGLACPSHCGSPAVGSLLAAFLFGFLSCLVVVGAIGLRCLGLPWPCFSPPVDPPSHGLARLSRYLHEPNTNSRQRRRWTCSGLCWTFDHRSWVLWFCYLFCSWTCFWIPVCGFLHQSSQHFGLFSGHSRSLFCHPCSFSASHRDSFIHRGILSSGTC